VVVLKGSGTIIAAPGHAPRINPTGNARLATGGTGDVLAGWIAALLAQGESAIEAALDAVYAHGTVADAWPTDGPTLSASALARAASEGGRPRGEPGGTPTP
jgi:NAD(P)H-hydrate repair Nnr-like enzyme with NAD(P)H-hydrate dehydratase domain